MEGMDIWTIERVNKKNINGTNKKIKENTPKITSIPHVIA
jgi:hypothetical protein